MSTQGWIGVDWDGTLVTYDGWRGPGQYGEPVPRMVGRVQGWLANGQEVRIFTARVGPQKDPADVEVEIAAINQRCLSLFGRTLPITATKDFAMVELWDDRCVQVEPNTGRRADGGDEHLAPNEDARAAEMRRSLDLLLARAVELSALSPISRRVRVAIDVYSGMMQDPERFEPGCDHVLGMPVLIDPALAFGEWAIDEIPGGVA
jgi:hypothetical protein